LKAPAEVSLRDQVEAYLAAVAPRYARTSLIIWRAGLERFQRYATEYGITTVAEVDEACLQAFHGWLLGFTLSESTVYMAMRSIKLFVQWSYQTGRTLWDSGSYKLFNPSSKVPQPPTVAVMKRLLELPNLGTPEGVRDLFALELLYVLGLRRAECCGLDLERIDLGAETLFVKGKGGDERLLPLSPKLKDTAWLYLRKGRPGLLPGVNEKALLLGDEGQRLTLSGLFYIAIKYSGQLGLRVTPHHIRHACATHLVEAGMELDQVQRLLGHRQLDSTKRYAQILGREMRREFVRSHPRALQDSDD
jgi:integrase/recombinase XerD